MKMTPMVTAINEQDDQEIPIIADDDETTLRMKLEFFSKTPTQKGTRD